MPEFDKTKQADDLVAYVFDADCDYDMILGQDFLSKAGIKLNFDIETIKWMDNAIRPMKERGQWNNLYNWYTATETFEEDKKDEEAGESFQILDAKYEQVDPTKVAEAQSHLTPEQRKKLKEVLEKPSIPFDGNLGKYDGDLSR